MKYLQLVVVLFCLVAGFFAGKSCTRPEVVTETVTVSDTIHVTDSISYPLTDTVLVPYMVIKRDTVFITNEIDTISMKKLFEDYFLTRLYDPTILNDSNGVIKLHMTVTENKLTGFSITEMTLYKDTEYIENTVSNIIKPKCGLYIGVGIGYDKLNNNLPLAGKIKFQDRKHRIYGYSYNPFSNIHEIEASFPMIRW